MRRLMFALWVSLITGIASAEPVKLAVTTSFNNSGLSDILLPVIKRDTGIEVQLLIVGTGQALRLGEAGDVDARPASAVAPDPAASVARNLDLHSAILTLPPRERACVVLRYLDDKPIAAVASDLGLAVGSVKLYLSDATARLRALDLDIEDDPEPGVPVISHHTGGRS